MLSFSITRSDGQSIPVDATHGLQVYCDGAGMGLLIETLGRLVRERGGHVHLLPPDVAERSPFGESAFSEVIFDYVEVDPMEESTN